MIDASARRASIGDNTVDVLHTHHHCRISSVFCTLLFPFSMHYNVFMVFLNGPSGRIDSLSLVHEVIDNRIEAEHYHNGHKYVVDRSDVVNLQQFSVINKC